MSPILIGILGVIVMILMFMTRMPVAFVMALVGFAGFSYMTSPNAGLVLLSRNVYETFAAYDLTTIRQPCVAIGQTAMTMLLDILSARLTEPEIKLIPTELIVRGSTGPVAG